MLDNMLLTSVGSLIGASGSILSYIMVSLGPRLGLILQCRAMNRSLTNVIFGGIALTQASEGKSRVGSRLMKPDSTKGLSVSRTNVDEVVEMLGNAENAIVVPGYGQSLSQHWSRC